MSGDERFFSILPYLDLPERELDPDQGVYPLVVDPILRVLTDIVLLGGEADLVIVHILLPPYLLTIGLIKSIIREDFILDLILDVLINVQDLHHHLLVPLQEGILKEDLILDSLFSLIKRILLQGKISHKVFQRILRKNNRWICLLTLKTTN